MFYLLRTEGEQEFLILAGGQNPCLGTDVENVISGQVEVDMRDVFPWERSVQAGLYDLPGERQLQVSSPAERDRD